MQLITAGKGFIGLNTARAMLELGESCVLTTSSPKRPLPEFAQKELGKRLFVEALDLADRKAFLEIGRRHKISGIVHLSGAVVGRGTVEETFAEAQFTVQGLFNAIFAANEWGTTRIAVASTIGVYAGSGEGPFHEDSPLSLSMTHPLPMSKKVLELLGNLLAAKTGVQILNLRIGGVWGPLNHHPLSQWNVPGQLVKAAVRGQTLDFSQIFAEDGGDSCYAKDTGRAIALLQLAPKLTYSTYNVGTGCAMANREIIAAIQKVIPEFKMELPQGFNPDGPGRTYAMDVNRLLTDTKFKPMYDVESGVADYIAWLQAGNEV